MFKRILGTVVEALARRKPAVPEPPVRRLRPAPPRPAQQGRDADGRGRPAGGDATAAGTRTSAVGSLTDTARLLELADQPATRGAALTRLAELAATDSLGDLFAQRPDLRFELLLASHDPAYAEGALAGVTTVEALIKIATSAQMPRVRQLAAARIVAEADLAELERRSRGHDKTVHRAAKTRLEELRRQQAQSGAHTAALQQLRERVVQLQRSEHDPLFNARLDHLQHSFAAWQSRAAELSAQLPAAADEVWAATDVASMLASCAARAAASAAVSAAAATAPVRPAAADRPVQPASDASTVLSTPASIAASTTASTAASNATSTAASTAAEGPDAPGAFVSAAPAGSARQQGDGPTAAAHAQPATAAASDAEHTQALADLQDVLADVCRDATQVLDRLALVPPALQLLQRRWSTASDRAPPPTAVADGFRTALQQLQDGVAAAQRCEQSAAEVERLIALPAREHAAPEEPDDFRRLAGLQLEQQQRARRAQDLLHHIRWPAAIPGPAAIAGLQAASAAAEAFVAHCNSQWQRVQMQLASVLEELERAVEGGVYRTANSHLGDARRLLRCLPNRLSGKLQSRCTTLAARVQEMRDWQDFATHPKREALCASMASLVEEQLEPESRADRIKALRAAWHDLGPLTSASERALFDRFNAAAELAFAPSRAHFEEQARLRAANLVHRERVCTTLADYVANNDWSRADWKLAQQVLRLAREEFLTYSPVDRGPGREVGKRFDAAADALHALIKAEWDKNVAIKERIVTDAAQLLASTEPPSIRIERVKALQHDWRNAGATPRGADQKLWKLFRAHCDAVFAARDTERLDYERAAQSEADSADGICEALEARVADPTPIANQTELHGLRTRFDALQLAGDNGRRLQRRFKDGEQAYLQRLRDQQHAARRQDFLAVLRVHDVLAGFERDPATLDDTLLTAAVAQAADADLAERVAALRSDTPPVASGAHAARQRWTIYAEILAGLESPPEDQSLRLELQVNRLTEGLGRRGGERLDLPAVLNAWVSAGADPGDLPTAAWRARLDKAVDAYLG